MGCTGREHHQPVEPERNAARRRHDAQRADEIIIDWIAFVVDALLHVHLREQPPPLLVSLSQFAEAVGEPDAAQKYLEALRHARIASFGARERRHLRRIFVENGRTTDAEMRLD